MLRIPIFIIIALLPFRSTAQDLPETARSRTAIANKSPGLQAELEAKGLSLGSPIFMRIFKEEKQLEVWVEQDNSFKLFNAYDICYYSGGLGTKTRLGDGKSPEGFYFINKDRLNPWSNYHLSFNLGYPNAYERAKHYTGNYLMIHGSCVSIGCYAMTDDSIEELYTLGHKAIANGQTFFRVHSFPFKMTDQNMARHANNPSISFWQNLKMGYDWFETHHTPPNVTVLGGEYVFGN